VLTVDEVDRPCGQPLGIPTFLGWLAAIWPATLIVMTTEDSTHQHTAQCWWNPDQASWTCGADDAAGAGALLATERPLIDVRDMIVVHNALLREFRLLASAVTRVPPDASRRAAAVLRHLALLTDLLHHHHHGEDALLWPLLQQRLPTPALDAINDAQAQHGRISESLDQVASARQAWADHRDIDRRETLAGELRSLHALLDSHLDLEERRLLPLAAGVLTQAEWHAIGEAAVAAMPKSTLLLTFGMFAYEGDPAVLRDMLRTAPALPRLLLPRLAPHAYAARATRVYGTPTP
jgi:hemerythrin-like domain-containing protein